MPTNYILHLLHISSITYHLCLLYYGNRYDFYVVSKTTDELSLKWSEPAPVVLYENLKLPQFQITNVTVALCNEKFQIGEFARLT